MIRRPPRSTPLYSSAASDVYKRQCVFSKKTCNQPKPCFKLGKPVSYTHLRAHETKANLVCRLLLEKKKTKKKNKLLTDQRNKNTNNKKNKKKINIKKQ